MSPSNIFTENSLYSNSVEREDLLKDKERLMDSLIINFFGFLGLFKLNSRRNSVRRYSTDEMSVRPSNIGDGNFDVSLSLKMAFDAGLLRTEVMNKMTRLLAAIKTKKIQNSGAMDETLVRELAVEIRVDTHRPSMRLYSLMKKFIAAEISLPQLTKAAYMLSKKKEYKGISSEFREMVQYGGYLNLFKNIPDDSNTPTSTQSQIAASPIPPTTFSKKSDVLNKIPGEGNGVGVVQGSQKKLSHAEKIYLLFPNWNTVEKVRNGVEEMGVDTSTFDSEAAVRKVIDSPIVKGQRLYSNDEIESTVNAMKEVFRLSIPDSQRIRWMFYKINLEVIINRGAIGQIDIPKDIVELTPKMVTTLTNNPYLLQKAASANFSKIMVDLNESTIGDSQKVSSFKAIFQSGLFDILSYENERIGLILFLLANDLMGIKNHKGETAFSALNMKRYIFDLKLNGFYGNSIIGIESNGATNIKVKFDDALFMEEREKTHPNSRWKFDIFKKGALKGIAEFRKVNDNQADRFVLAIVNREYSNSRDTKKTQDIVSLRSINPREAASAFSKLNEKDSQRFAKEAYNLLFSYMKHMIPDVIHTLEKVIIEILPRPHLDPHSSLDSLSYHCVLMSDTLPKAGFDRVEHIISKTNSDVDLNEISKFLVNAILSLNDEGVAQTAIRLLQKIMDNAKSDTWLHEYILKVMLSRTEPKGHQRISKLKFKNISVVLDFLESALHGPLQSETIGRIRALKGVVKNSQETVDFAVGKIKKDAKSTEIPHPFISELTSNRIPWALLLSDDEIPSEYFEVLERDSGQFKDLMKYDLNHRVFQDNPKILTAIKVGLERSLAAGGLTGFINRSPVFMINLFDSFDVIREIRDDTALSLLRTHTHSKTFLAHLEKNLEKDPKVARQYLEKLISFARTSVENKRKYAPEVRKEALNLVYQAFETTFKVDPLAVDEVFKELKGEVKAEVIKSVFEADFLERSAEEFMSDSHPIKPMRKLSSTQIRAILEKNNVDVGKQPNTKSIKLYSDLKLRTGIQLREISSKLHVDPVDRSSEDFERMSCEYDEFNNGRHGPIAVKILREFDVEIPIQVEGQVEFEKEFPDSKVIERAFHGCGSIAASFILRYGYAVFKAGSSGVAITGRMLGDGIYVSDTITKAIQYASDDGMKPGRSGIGGSGYLLLQRAVLGKEDEHYREAGTDAKDSIRSPEWVLFDPNRQLRIYKAFQTMTIHESEMAEMKKKFGIAENKNMRIVGFKKFLKERVEPLDDFITAFVLADGKVPIGPDDYIDYTELSKEDLKRKKCTVEETPFGIMLTFHHNGSSSKMDDEVHYIKSIQSFMEDQWVLKRFNFFMRQDSSL